MDARTFHNALRIMRNIGETRLREFGVIDENWGEPEASNRDQLGDFFRDPYAEAIRMPDANFDRLFALIESRQPMKHSAINEAARAQMNRLQPTASSHLTFIDPEDRSGEAA